MKKLWLVVAMLILVGGCTVQPPNYYQEKVTRFNEKVDIAQDAASQGAEAYDVHSQKDVVTGWIEGLIKGNAVSSPINPYAPIIGTGLAALLAGYSAVKKREAVKKYKAHKQGVENFNLEHPTTAKEMYNSIGKARSRNSV